MASAIADQVSNPLLTSQKMGCQRGGLLILKDLDITLLPGAALQVAGPNGIGKTTLLRVLAGLAPPAKGQLDVDPEAVIYIGHQDGIKAQLSVRENLQFWAGIYGQTLDHALVDRLELSELMDRFAARLSAGQKRRLGLCRLFLSKARIWVLDEPTTALDQDKTRFVLDELARHRAGGGAVILSSHIDLPIKGLKQLALLAHQTQGQDLDDPFLQGGF